MIEKVAAMIAYPGEWICDQLNLKGEENRVILRLAFNLAIYAFIAMMYVVLFVDFTIVQ